MISLHETSRKNKTFREACCSDKLLGEYNNVEYNNAEYIKLLARGGLLEPSIAVSDVVGQLLQF